MITGNELLHLLATMTPEARTLPIYGIHGASGVSYEITGGDVKEVRDPDTEIGPLAEVDRGTKYLEFYLE